MDYKLNDTIVKYFDDNFWSDLIEDTYNLNVQEYIDAYCKNIKKALKLIPVGSKNSTCDKKFWEKVYQYKKINYSKPITYKYFKDVMLSTHTLINLVHLQIDLHQSLKTIEKSFEFPLNKYFKLDVKGILNNLIAYRIDPFIGDCTIEDAFAEINEKVGIDAPWHNINNLYREYWIWLWLFISLHDAGFDSLYKLKLESINYRESFIRNIENLDFEPETVDSEDKKKPYNAKTNKENAEWEKCRKVYSIIGDEYRIAKVLTSSAYKNISKEKIIKNIGNLGGSDNDNLYLSLLKAVATLFPMQENWFDNFKNYLFDNCSWMYQLLFRQNNFNSLEEVYTFFNNTKIQQASLDVIKFSFDIVKNKSDKTILNTISDMEYCINKKKPKYCPMEDISAANDKIIDKYTITQSLILQSYMIFTQYLQTPTINHFEDLNLKLKTLKDISKIIPN